MALKRKKIIYGLIIMAMIAAYLILAHYSIFYRIKYAGLKAPDRQDSYTLGANKNMISSSLYAALGDSLTAGVGASKYEESYPFLLAQKFTFQADGEVNLKNYSYPGAKTSDLINDLLTPAIAVKPDVVTLLIGVNDVYGNVSPAVFRKNYQLILDRLSKETKAKIYLINLPYLGSSKLLLTPYNYYYGWRTAKFNEIIRELAAAYSLKYIDLAEPTLVESKKNSSYYAEDLFHPSAVGYKLWARIIYDAINQ